jgi:ABC-type sugar transport system ATPase subunit
MATVELRGVSKSFGSTEVLHNLNISVEEREFMVLVGPSGSGKSTALRLVAGLEAPTTGDVLIDGRRVNDLAPRERNVAMVFQSYALYPHMSVFDNLSFSLRLAGQRRAAVAEHVEGVAQGLGIAGLLRRKPRQLSGGQRQRVAVGRAIVRRPGVFLMDEPLSNLDAQLRAQTRVSLMRLHREIQSTVIYVTHDQVEAMTLGDRIVILKDGLVQQVASPEDVYRRPANRFVASFIGSPTMNMLPVEIQGSEPVRLVAEGVGIALPAGGFVRGRVPAPGKVLLGIRPEHVRDEAAARRLGLPIVRGEVEITENLGSDLLVHVRVGSWTLCAKFGGDVRIRPGEPVALGIDIHHCHLFEDSEEGRRLDVGFVSNV